MKHYRSITAELTFNSYAATFLLQMGRANRALAKEGQIVSYGAGHWKYLPPGDFPVLPYTERSWRVYAGGLLCSIQPKPLKSTRACGVFVDPTIARLALIYENTLLRRSMYLKYIEGRWFATMKYQTLVGLRKVVKGRSVSYVPIRKRRWKDAPADWPRDVYGRPVTTRKASIIKERATSDMGFLEKPIGPFDATLYE